MSNYSYSEIQKMQQKAMERVRQMQRNSEALVSETQQDFPKTPKEEKTFFEHQPIAPKVTNMPPNFPENISYPSFKEFFKEESKQQTVKSAKKENVPKKTEKSAIESIFAETDKAMLMGLVMLLKSEGADEMLIMALLYIMS